MTETNLTLDARTFMFVLGIFGIFMSFLSYSFLRSLPKSILGIREWSIAMFAMGTAFFCFMLRGIAPDITGHFFGNAAALMATTFVILATLRFYRINKLLWPVRILNLFFLLALIIEYSIFGAEIPANRVVIVGLPAALNLSSAAVINLKYSNRTFTLATLVPVGSLFVFSASLGFRAVNVLLGNTAQSQLFSNSRTQVIFFLAAGIATVAGSVGFILMSIERLGQEIVEQTAKTQHASRLSAIGEMAGGIAHEINNPLAIIQGSLTILENHLEQIGQSDQKVTDRLSRISAAIERITRIIRALRTFTRQSEADPMVVTDLKTIMEDTLDLCSEKLRAQGVEIQVQAVPHVSIECQSVQISQVLINLLNNAFDSVIGQKIEKPFIRIDFESSPQFIKIAVVNPGPPLSEEVKARLFQPFFSTKEVGKGTGLGLSISKNIIDQHRGKLSVQESNGFVSFILELPLRPA